MDSIRAKEILNSNNSIEVLYRGEPVWIENVKDTNTAVITNLDNKRTEEVPVYLLVEKS